jgi:LPXTG-motif cell wall-anchored protein
MFRKIRAGLCAAMIVAGVSLVAVPHASAATIEVTNINDAGAGSFRQAVLDASPGDTITFAAALNGQTITLLSELIIGVDVTIEGNGPTNTIITPNVDDIRIRDANVTVRGIHLTGGGDEGAYVETVEGNTTAVFENMLITANGNDGLDVERNGGNLSITVRNSMISDNNSEGIELTATGGAGSLNLVIEDSTISSNASDGVDARDGTVVTITRSTVSLNGNDGVVGNGAGTRVTATDSTFSGNVGDGVDIEDGATLSLVNSTLSDNLSSGIDGNESAGSSTILNTTIVNNGSDGVQLSGSAPATITNSIVYGNDGSDCLGPVVSGGGNIAGDASCNLTGTADQPNTNPQLGPLANNGGTTGTHLPQTGSPAIDAGLAGPCPATDQRGQARPQDGDNNGSAICDIGAVEVAALPVTTTTAPTTTAAPVTTAPVTAPAPTTSPAVPTTIVAELPATGDTTASTQVWISIGLLGAGLAFVAASRRRATNQ